MEMAAAAEKGNEPERDRGSDRIGAVLRTEREGRAQGKGGAQFAAETKALPALLPPSPLSLPLIPARSLDTERQRDR